METQTPSPTADAAQLAIIQKKLVLDGKIRNGVNWFFWIFGLSLINTVVYLLGKTFTFVLGLGVTQIVDGFMYALASELGTGGSVVRLIGFVIDVFIAGIFLLIGILGRKRNRTAIIIGMILYAVDGIILLLFQDFLSAGFHAFALVGIWNGLRSISELGQLEKDGNSESIESIRKRMPSLQPQVTPQQRRTRWILVGLILLVIVIFLILASFPQ
jgi:hypothetical protein